MVFFVKSLLLVGLCCCFTLVQAQNTSLKLPYATHIQNTFGQVIIENDGVKIKADKGTDIFTDTTGTKSVNRVPMLSFTPKGDFIFSVKVAADFTGAYDGGAILVILDDNHWGKLLFERFKMGSNGVATTVSTGRGDDAYHGTRESVSQYLKVARHGASYVFYSSNDGNDWTFLRHFSVGSDKPAKIALAAQSPLSEGVVVTFTEIAFKSGTFEDFWQGK